ncbi:MAG TPA: 2-amino-4-hydroxy-6-hydroxymethyldihydropteridine diphosphokinase [Mycobacterium sp.]
MSRAVLSIGSNLGDRLARLQSAVDGFGNSVRAISRVYETEAWGGVDQGRFLNAVLIVDDPARDGHGWLYRAHELERAAGRVRHQRWGPRTLDVDVISCFATTGEPAGMGRTEILSRDRELTLPHPLAHLRAFVMVPWLEIDADAELTVAGRKQRVVHLVSELNSAELAGTRPTALVLRGSDQPAPRR